MGLQNGTLFNGGSIAVTGGTIVTLSVDGQQVIGGIHLQDASVPDYRTRPNATAKTKLPNLNADGTYGKGKKSFTLVFPRVLESGKQGFPLVRIELEDFPEMTSNDIDKMCVWAAQVLSGASFVNFWRTGSLS